MDLKVWKEVWTRVCSFTSHSRDHSLAVYSQTPRWFLCSQQSWWRPDLCCGHTTETYPWAEVCECFRNVGICGFYRKTPVLITVRIVKTTTSNFGVLHLVLRVCVCVCVCVCVMRLFVCENTEGLKIPSEEFTARRECCLLSVSDQKERLTHTDTHRHTNTHSLSLPINRYNEVKSLLHLYWEEAV